MSTTKMSFQRFFLIAGILTLTTTIGLFSSVYTNVTYYQGFGFHDFVTQGTLALSIFKNDGFNNLQDLK